METEAAKPGMDTDAYSARVARTVQAQMSRAEANALFREGKLEAAASGYELVLADPLLEGSDKLALLSNLALCYLRLSKPRAVVSLCLDALKHVPACFAAPDLAMKAAGRLLEGQRLLKDATGARHAVSECRFYADRARELGATAPSNLALPAPAPAAAVEALLMAVGGTEDEVGLPAVREALLGAAAEDLDDHRMNALGLAVHVASMRPGPWACKLLSLLLGDTPGASRQAACEGTVAPADARHEVGRTALMLAANNGRLDMCTVLLEAGASPVAADSAGYTPLHTACLDLQLVAERQEAGMDCEPGQVVALLLAHGADPTLRSAEGLTAFDLCECESADHEAASACALLLAPGRVAEGEA